jgi:hypothetical protein
MNLLKCICKLITAYYGRPWRYVNAYYIYIYIYVWKLHQTVLELDVRAVIQWDKYIVWLSLASRRLYDILYFLWLYNEFFIILYNISKIAELDCCQIIILSTPLIHCSTIRLALPPDCCQIIILSIYVPSTHAYTHVLRVSLDLPYEKR